MKTITAIIGLWIILSNVALAQVPDSIPRFKKFLKMENNAPFTYDSLDRKKTQVFVLFDPGCGHCQELGQGIGNILDSISKDVDIFFVSLQEKALVDGFVNMFAKKLKNHPQVHFLYDPEGEFILLFDPKNFPSTYVYSKKKFKLVQFFDGDNKAIKILPFLKKTVSDK